MVINTVGAMRIGIFFFYDKDGIVDDYVKHLLDEMNVWLTDLYVVINGEIQEKSLEMLQGIATKVMVRENEGFDVWAYKAAIDDLGWETLSTYDEMIMFNFTIFGPFFPFEEMFHKMDKEDVDFWGITKHYALKKDAFWGKDAEKIPTHLQSHFIAVRKDMISNQDYQEYWNKHVFIHDYREAVLSHEAIFTKTFADKGFSWGTYIDTDDMEQYTSYPLMAFPEELLKRRCPILKRKGFFLDYMSYIQFGTYGEVIEKAFDFIKTNTDYNTDYIWENILRTGSMNEIRNCFRLDKIIEECNDESPEFYHNAMLFCIITDYTSKELFVEYIRRINGLIQVYVVSALTEQETMRYVEELEIQYELVDVNDRNSIISAVLKHAKGQEHEVIGFLPDTDFSIDPEKTWHGVECMINSVSYIKGVEKTFFEDKKLGMLAVPRLYHGANLGRLGMEWENDSNRRKAILERYEVSVVMPEDGLDVYAVNDMAWYRKERLVHVLEELEHDNYLSNQEMRWLIALKFQQQGMYCAYGMPVQVGCRDLNNYRYFFNQYQSVINRNNLVEDFGSSLYYLKETLGRSKGNYEELEQLREYAKRLESQLDEKQKVMADAKEYNERLEKEVAEVGDYAKHLEKEIEEMRKVINDAAEYSAQLEHQLAVYQENR